MVEPERQLWRAVLNQAYQDAEIHSVLDADAPETRERIRGRRFLRADGPEEAADLAEICELADVPADVLIRWARRRYESQPPAPPRRKPGPRSKQELPVQADGNASTTEGPTGESPERRQ